MPTGSPPPRRWIGKALGDEAVVNLPAIHSLDELAELDIRVTLGKRFWDQVDNYSRLSIYKIRGENCANRSHGATIATPAAAERATRRRLRH